MVGGRVRRVGRLGGSARVRRAYTRDAPPCGTGSHRFAVALFCIVLALFVATNVTALDWAQRTIRHDQQLAATGNPIGLSLLSRLMLSVPLFDEANEKRQGVLWDSTRIEAGIVNRVTPAFDDIGVEAFIEPIAIFDVRARAVYRQMYTIAGNGYTPLPDADADYRPKADLDRFERGGMMVEVTPRLKGALGPVVVLNATTFRRVSMRIKSGESGVFYENLGDVAQENGQWQVTNGTTALWNFHHEEGGNGDTAVLLGIDYTLNSIEFRASEWQRLSVIALWNQDGLWGPQGPSITVTAIIGSYLDHRYFQTVDGEVYLVGQLGLAWTH